MGLSMYPDHGNEAEQLVRRADIALYNAKTLRHDMEVYEVGQDEDRLEKLQIISDLQEALRSESLTLNFQPKIHFGKSDALHAEVLLRWEHPQKGWVSPERFIPLAEQAGLISEITNWVLDRACAQLSTWRQNGTNLHLAINLSVIDLMDQELDARIRQTLDTHNIQAEWLTLEVTESAAMQDLTMALESLEKLRALGLRLAIDDFGTGQSSLAQIKRLPVNELKIDKSFVQNLEGSENDQVIVRSAIELGHNMGMTVVAEGIESDVGNELLREMACDMGQGFWISRPLAMEQFNEWLRTNGGKQVQSA